LGLPPFPPHPAYANHNQGIGGGGGQHDDGGGGDPDGWPSTGLRLFVGNLGNEVGDDELLSHFAAQYPACQRAHVVRDHKNKNASKGFGFVWFADPMEGARAKREMDQTWLLSRPIRIKKYHQADQPQDHRSGSARNKALVRPQQSGRRNRR
jgi:RNA recognition motif-containing protein